jgi:hypothetical protein
LRRIGPVAAVVASSATGTPRERTGFGRMALGALLAFAALLATLTWAGELIGPNPDSESSDAVWIWAAFIALPAAAYLLQVVHELGHLVAAKALGLRVIGMRLSVLHVWSHTKLPGTGGHVMVNLNGDETRLPLRMVLFALGGPAAVLVVALATATIANDQSAPLWLREVSVGVCVAAVCDALANLLPRRIGDDLASDGWKALGWAFRPAVQRARLEDRLDLARLRLAAASTPLSAGHQREYFRTAVDDPRPDMAMAGMTELLRRRPRRDDGWDDFDVIARFSARDDISPAARASISGNYSLSLSLAYLSSLRAGEQTDPHAPTVQRIEQLAQLALAADRESLAGRAALGLVRVLQDRPAEAQTLLVDIDRTASPVSQARAYAVRGIAEAELGDLSQAVSLGLVARKLAPAEVLLEVLDAVVQQKSA